MLWLGRKVTLHRIARRLIGARTWPPDEYGSEMTAMRIGSIVIHCYEFDRMMALWGSVLGYVPREKRREHRSWLHLDLYTNDQQGEVERLLRLGAIGCPWRFDPGDDFAVLEDPDGNLFCVVRKPE